MTEALVLKNDAPATVVVLTAEIETRIETTRRELAGVTAIDDVFGLATADELYLKGRKLLKEIEEERIKVKAPFLSISTQIDKLAKDAGKPLSLAVDELSTKIIGYQREQARLEREAQAKAEAERQKALMDAEASRKAQEALMTPEQAKIAPPVIAPIVAPLRPIPQVIKSSAITTKMVKVLVIDDPKLIPYSIGGKVLLVPNESVIEALLRAGMEIPGCRLEEQESITKKRGV